MDFAQYFCHRIPSSDHHRKLLYAFKPSLKLYGIIFVGCLFAHISPISKYFCTHRLSSTMGILDVFTQYTSSTFSKILSIISISSGGPSVAIVTPEASILILLPVRLLYKRHSTTARAFNRSHQFPAHLS